MSKQSDSPVTKILNSFSEFTKTVGSKIHKSPKVNFVSSRVSLVRDLDDKHDKTIFISLVFGGILLILLTRMLGDSFSTTIGISGFDWLAIIFAVGMILGYSTFVYISASRSSLSIDRASDNVYYLGLLYTLASLSYSLVKLGGIVSMGSEQTAEASSRGVMVLSLLPDFGLALASTIAGIFFRVLLQQMRGDVVDVESEVRVELGEAARSLRSNLLNIVADLKILSTSVSESLREVNEEMTRTLKENADENAKVIKDVITEFKLLSKSTDTQIKKMGQFTEKTTNAVEAILSEIGRQLEASAQTPQLLNDEIQRTINKLEEMTDKISANTERNEEATTASLKITSEIIDNMNKIDLGDVSNRLEEIRGSITDFNGKIVEINSELEASSEIAKQFTSQQKDAGDVTDRYLNVLDKAANKMNTILKG